MKKVDMIREISKKTNFTYDNVDIALNAFIEVMQEAMQAGEEKIVLKGIGTFKRKVAAARDMKNPRTGEPIKVPEKVSYSFKISNLLKDSLNS